MSDTTTNAKAAKGSGEKPPLTIPKPPRSRRRPAQDDADAAPPQDQAKPQPSATAAPAQEDALPPVASPAAQPVASQADQPPANPAERTESPPNLPAVASSPASLPASPGNGAATGWQTYGTQQPPQPPFNGLPNGFFAPPPPNPIPGVEPKTEVLGLRCPAADVEWWQSTTTLAQVTYKLPRGVLPRIAVEVIKAHFPDILREAVHHVHGVDIGEQSQ
jgi:hypothetical protein